MSTPFFALRAAGKIKKTGCVIRCSTGAPIRAETGAKQSCGRLRRPRRLGRPRARLPPRLAAAAPALPSEAWTPSGAPSAPPCGGCSGTALGVRSPARVSPPAPISRGGKAAAYKILVLSNWLRQLPTKQNILYNCLGRERPALGGLVHHITILLNLKGHSPIKFCELNR